jgi:hypothetical protein
MKIMRIAISIALTILIFVCSSCSTKNVIVVAPKNAPPGQVKKATGSQSAKPYAPGQQKKKL